MRFFVPGKAETKGSARGFVVKGKRGKMRAAITNDNPKAKSWQRAISIVAASSAERVFTGPCRVTLRFQMARPKRTKRTYPSVRPDLDKLIRCALDGMTGVVFGDDSQVVEVTAKKAYDSEPGMVVDVEEIA